jgi:hypothetical protein
MYNVRPLQQLIYPNEMLNSFVSIQAASQVGRDDCGVKGVRYEVVAGRPLIVLDKAIVGR